MQQSSMLPQRAHHHTSSSRPSTALSGAAAAAPSRRLRHASSSSRRDKTAAAVVVQCSSSSFSFASSERANRPTGRRNRFVEKKSEGELRSISQGLCNFNGKQLQAVAHLLSEEHLRQIRIGMDIPATNQGRKRQVGLVMGLLRADLDESTLAKLSAAVQQAARYNLPFSDSDVEQQLDVWMEGLVANDQEVVSELFGALEGRQQDWQQLRTWARVLQQHEQQKQEQQQQQDQQDVSQQQQLEAVLSSNEALQVDAGTDPETLELLLQRQQQQQETKAAAAGGGAGSSKGKAGKSPAAAARRSLRRMLKPLALKQL